MRTGTATSRAVAADAWDPVLASAGPQAQELGEQILALAHEVAVKPLRGPLTDPGRTSDDKALLVARLFAGRVDERVVALLQALVRGRWSHPVDLITALHDLGIQAILTGARAGGTLDDVEQQLFAVQRVLADNREIRESLEPSRRSRQDDRVDLARHLFASHISAPAMSLVIWCVRHRPGITAGGVPHNLRRVTELAAALQNRTIADVVTAIPMTRVQEARLRAVLAQRIGTDIELNTKVDPSVIGGVRVSVRDLVMDSTVRSTVTGLRNRLTG